MSQIKQDYRTRDVYFAAYLKVSGLVFSHPVRDANVVYFVFERTPNLKDLKTQYYKYQDSVSARRYAETLKEMKKLLTTV